MPRSLNNIYLVLWSALVFLGISGWGSDLGTIAKLHVEQLTLLSIMAVIPVFVFRGFTFSQPLPLGICTLYMFLFVWILLSDQLFQSDRSLFNSSLLRHQMKLMIALPLLLLIPTPRKWQLYLGLVFVVAVASSSFLNLFYWLKFERFSELRLWVGTRNGDPNILSAFLIVATFIVFSIRGNFAKNFRWILDLLCLVNIFFMLFAQSRMAIFTFVLCCCLYLLFYHRRLFPWAVSICAIVFFVVTNLSSEIVRVNDISDSSAWHRIVSIIAGSQAFYLKPIMGWGFAYGEPLFYMFGEYPYFQNISPSLDIHNTWIQAFAELGVIGGGLYSLIWLVVGGRILIEMKEKPSLSNKKWLFFAWLATVLNMSTLPLLHHDGILIIPVLLLVLKDLDQSVSESSEPNV